MAILSKSNDWIIIDPKGMIGDPAYEIAAFMRNPIPELLSQSNIIELMHRRIKSFAHILNMDEKRIAQWSFIGTILAHIWDV